MSILSDGTIKELLDKGEFIIEPYDPEMIQPASIDIRLGVIFSTFKVGVAPYIDLKKPLDDLMETHDRSDGTPFILHPGEFALANTMEWISLPDWITARLDGKSSLGRVGLVIHSTAGWIDPGFKGTITLELSNDATLPITLYPHMPIGQLSFERMDKPVLHPYAGKYQNQGMPTPSKMSENFTESQSEDETPFAMPAVHDGYPLDEAERRLNEKVANSEPEMTTENDAP